MNVGHPSNLARLIDLYGGQMDEAGNVHKKPDLNKIREEIVSYTISDELTRKTIKEFYNKYQKIIEPHGAVGWACLEIYREKYPQHNQFKAVNLETADPAKFPEEIIDLIKINPKMPKSLENIQNNKEFPNPVEINKYEDFKIFLSKNFDN